MRQGIVAAIVGLAIVLGSAACAPPVDDSAVPGIGVTPDSTVSSTRFTESELMRLVGPVVDEAHENGIDVQSGGVDAEAPSVWFSGPELLDESKALKVLADLVREHIGEGVLVEIHPWEDREEVVSGKKAPTASPRIGDV